MRMHGVCVVSPHPQRVFACIRIRLLSLGGFDLAVASDPQFVIVCGGLENIVPTVPIAFPFA